MVVTFILKKIGASEWNQGAFSSLIAIIILETFNK